MLFEQVGPELTLSHHCLFQIDPGYLQHPADIQILRESFKYVRTVAATAPLSQYLGDELSPGDDVSTDAEWDEWIRKCESGVEVVASSSAR